MSYIEADEIRNDLESADNLKKYLYIRGFIVTTEKIEAGDDYPFYSNWREEKISDTLFAYLHTDTYFHKYVHNDIVYFLIGHAYDPFTMETDEENILRRLAFLKDESTERFWDGESDLTGVFCLGFIEDGNVIYTTDCCGMQLVYHGVIGKHLFLSSHSKLIADLKGLRQPEYITRLVSGRYWHYWGTWLPGDLSPFDELKRVNPNTCGEYRPGEDSCRIRRFYPTKKITEIKSEEEYTDTIRELGRILSDSIGCIVKKWPDKKVSLSVTGGRDSMSALACSGRVYDKLDYFSYISNTDESVDAEAAGKILDHLGLKHELYRIPEEYDGYRQLPVFKKLMECNNGCIGENNENDLKKRLYFLENPPCDVEIKSWVNEMGRGWYYNKYKKKRFPEYPDASYWRAMHKVYVSPYLIRETDKVFHDYLAAYYDKETFDRISWLELYFWEFSWGGGESLFLNSEHRVSYDITIPFNNRKYIELMLTVPLEKRKADAIPNDLIAYMEPRITETGITVRDISHTDFRAMIIRSYLEVFSHIRFGSKKEKY